MGKRRHRHHSASSDSSSNSKRSKRSKSSHRHHSRNRDKAMDEVLKRLESLEERFPRSNDLVPSDVGRSARDESSHSGEPSHVMGPSTKTGTGPHMSDSDSESDDVLSVHADDSLDDILGAVSNTVTTASEVHPEICTRWVRIVTQGLDKSASEDLAKLYPTPSNCLEFNAPKLNPELDLSLSEGLRKKEDSMVSLQKLA